MKSFLTFSLLFSVFHMTHGREWVSKVNKYIHKDSNQIIELGGWDLSEDGKTNSYYNYTTSKRETILMADYIPATLEEIANVRAGEVVIAKTYVAHSKSEIIERVCEVYYLFENQKAFVGCKSYSKDNLPGYITPVRFDFIINNVEQVVAQVSELDGFSKGDNAELLIETPSIKIGKTVRILAVMANGEALVQKMGFSVLDTSSIVYKSGIERVRLNDLRKI